MILNQMCPLITWNGKDLTTCVKCLLNVHGKTAQFFFWFTHLSRIKLCRDYALFGGHFWTKFDGRGHENILKDRGVDWSLWQLLDSQDRLQQCLSGQQAAIGLIRITLCFIERQYPQKNCIYLGTTPSKAFRRDAHSIRDGNIARLERLMPHLPHMMKSNLG